ncbi:dihydrofolate reductase family protein [Georgenia subflava]|uniref:Dihydrofolate reductase n=1 Tax=Georgenia subflava TaxID=1622177 RepID=A0A6N7EN32_9MICO|nr:dihydrofolate reductase family protein [Georgenia subflava]MPV38277.1 dihydrofolate reductase [Georgenia subflava]
MRTQYYTASSVDGFIADPDNSLDWLLTRDIDEKGPMSYPSFIADVGAVAMGATTYEWLLEHELSKEGATWPYTMPSWVFTHRDLPGGPGADITFTSDDVRDVHRRMSEAAAGKNLWVVGGGDLAGQFADLGLLDELFVQYAPVTLGGGAPLLPRRIELRLEEVARNRDFTCARYTVVR